MLTYREGDKFERSRGRCWAGKTNWRAAQCLASVAMWRGDDLRCAGRTCLASTPSADLRHVGPRLGLHQHDSSKVMVQTHRRRASGLWALISLRHAGGAQLSGGVRRRGRSQIWTWALVCCSTTIRRDAVARGVMRSETEPLPRRRWPRGPGLSLTDSPSRRNGTAGRPGLWPASPSLSDPHLVDCRVRDEQRLVANMTAVGVLTRK
jgi:hypothetical protein